MNFMYKKLTVFILTSLIVAACNSGTVTTSEQSAGTQVESQQTLSVLQGKASWDDIMNATSQVDSVSVPTFFFHTDVTLTGKLVVMTLEHPIREEPLENSLVFKISREVMFKAKEGEDANDSLVDKIGIYEDNIQSKEELLAKYKNIIDKDITINASIYFAPSGNYPLLANMSKFSIKSK
jgi:hypothetical protein